MAFEDIIAELNNLSKEEKWPELATALGQALDNDADVFINVQDFMVPLHNHAPDQLRFVTAGRAAAFSENGKLDVIIDLLETTLSNNKPILAAQMISGGDASTLVGAGKEDIVSRCLLGLTTISPSGLPNDNYNPALYAVADILAPSVAIDLMNADETFAVKESLEFLISAFNSTRIASYPAVANILTEDMINNLLVNGQTQWLQDLTAKINEDYSADTKWFKEYINREIDSNSTQWDNLFNTLPSTDSDSISLDDLAVPEDFADAGPVSGVSIKGSAVSAQSPGQRQYKTGNFNSIDDLFHNISGHFINAAGSADDALELPQQPFIEINFADATDAIDAEVRIKALLNELGIPPQEQCYHIVPAKGDDKTGFNIIAARHDLHNLSLFKPENEKEFFEKHAAEVIKDDEEAYKNGFQMYLLKNSFAHRYDLDDAAATKIVEELNLHGRIDNIEHTKAYTGVTTKENPEKGYGPATAKFYNDQMHFSSVTDDTLSMALKGAKALQEMARANGSAEFETFDINPAKGLEADFIIMAAAFQAAGLKLNPDTLQRLEKWRNDPETTAKLKPLLDKDPNLLQFFTPPSATGKPAPAGAAKKQPEPVPA